MKALCRDAHVRSAPAVSLSIHFHLIPLFFHLLSLPFTVPPVGKDPLRVELRHGTRNLVTRKVLVGQPHVCIPARGDIVQEPLVTLRDGLDGPGKLR